MKRFLLITAFLSLCILVISIYESQYYHLPFVLLSLWLSWRWWPARKKEKPYRNNKTWKE